MAAGSRRGLPSSCVCRKNVTEMGFFLFVEPGIRGGSWDTFPTDKGVLLYLTVAVRQEVHPE